VVWGNVDMVTTLLAVRQFDAKLLNLEDKSGDTVMNYINFSRKMCLTLMACGAVPPLNMGDESDDSEEMIAHSERILAQGGEARIQVLAMRETQKSSLQESKLPNDLLSMIHDYVSPTDIDLWHKTALFKQKYSKK
jgi:hypothetical protein